MKAIKDLKLGFSDAENYRRKENKDLFNKIFVKNAYLEHLLQPSTYFLVGEKGTGKTAYAVFMANNDYKETLSLLKYIRETEYQKFITLKREKHLQLSDYMSIWKVIILLLFAKDIKDRHDQTLFSKVFRLKAINQAIDEYYKNAFSPEIINALTFIENTKESAELITKYLKIGGDQSLSVSFQESKFQVNLLYIQNQLELALAELKTSKNHILFIDGIDIRPGSIPYSEYLECIKGLANAVWSINNDFFANIKDSKGRFRVVLLVRPDIFNSMGLQNQANKIKDNSVVLDWRTTYPSYRESHLFELTDKLLSAQQDAPCNLGAVWDYYFPWRKKAINLEKESDSSFVCFLRLSYSRPRDIVTMIKMMQENFIQQRRGDVDVFNEKDFYNNTFQNQFSEYLMSGIKDQLAFYYSDKDYEVFLNFFKYLNGKIEFSFSDYEKAYTAFTEYVLNNHTDIPEFVESPNAFLQFLYDTNIISYIEYLETGEPLFRWCYRERCQSNISPKIKSNAQYRIHYGLAKALNVGFSGVK